MTFDTFPMGITFGRKLFVTRVRKDGFAMKHGVFPGCQILLLDGSDATFDRIREAQAPCTLTFLPAIVPVSLSKFSVVCKRLLILCLLISIMRFFTVGQGTKIELDVVGAILDSRSKGERSVAKFTILRVYTVESVSVNNPSYHWRGRFQSYYFLGVCESL